MTDRTSAAALGDTLIEKCAEVYYPRWQNIQDALWAGGIFHDEPQWLVSPEPFYLEQSELAFFETLGPHLLAFYKALNRLYMDSAKGHQPAWVCRYLDQGKPPELIGFGRMKRFRELIPDVIRPDVIPTDDGMRITELDSVPGGIGITGCLSRAYALLGDSVIGGKDGMVRGFAAMLEGRLNNRAGCLAIVVSDESESYRAEMTWTAKELRSRGLKVVCVHPRDLRFTEEALFVNTDGSDDPVAVIYRFYELFDLKNIPKAELVMYATKKERVVVTPPYKPWMEEKLAFALLHHPILKPFWEDTLGAETFSFLVRVMPRTWVLDPAPLPPSAIIPDLRVGDRAVSDWKTLGAATQRQRQFVIKPSGFSELAWGSRGVSVGHDLPQTEWAAALDEALASFSTTPYVLQEFHKGRLYDVMYYDAASRECRIMSGRARLSPYYFVQENEAVLAGILATVCPKDKKVIHGMRDAIMAPCAVKPS